MRRIAARFRLALAGKGLLLMTLALVFAALIAEGTFGEGHSLLERFLSAGFVFPGLFAFRTALLAFSDALDGEAVEVRGAVALASRSAGYSLKLPDGDFAEFILFNPWDALIPEGRYRVLIGRRSHVLVAQPVAEAA